MGTDLMGQTGSPQPSRAGDPELMLSHHHQLSSTLQTSHSSGRRVRAVLPLGSRFTSKLFTSKKKKEQESRLIKREHRKLENLQSHISNWNQEFFFPKYQYRKINEKKFCLSTQYFIQSIGGQLKKYIIIFQFSSISNFQFQFNKSFFNLFSGSMNDFTWAVPS